MRWVGDDAAVVRARAVRGHVASTRWSTACTSASTIPAVTRGRRRPPRAGRRAVGPRGDGRRRRRGVRGARACPTGFGDGRRARAACAAMEALAERTATTIAGGDLVRAPVLTLAVTVTGWADDARGARRARRRAARRRASSSPARWARAAAGLAVLDGRARGDARSSCAPTCGPSRAWPRGARWPRWARSAMIDLSDGLATDARHLARAQRRGDRDRPRRAAARAGRGRRRARSSASSRGSWRRPAARTSSCARAWPARRPGRAPRAWARSRPGEPGVTLQRGRRGARRCAATSIASADRRRARALRRGRGG